LKQLDLNFAFFKSSYIDLTLSSLLINNTNIHNVTKLIDAYSSELTIQNINVHSSINLESYLIKIISG